MKLTAKYKEQHHKTLSHHHGKAVGFRTDLVTLPNGKIAQREFLTHPGAVGVLAFESPNKIVLVKQYRYPVGEFTYEIPAGKLSKNEDPLNCVNRELEEEAGFKARKIKKLLGFWPTAAFSDELIHIYVATDLVETQVNPDDDEFIEIVRVSPTQMERMIYSGKIRDSKSIIAFLAWKNRFAVIPRGRRRGNHRR